MDGHMFCHCSWLLFSLFDHVSSHTFPAFKLIGRMIWYNIFDLMNLLVIFLPLFVKVRRGYSGQEIGRVLIDESIFVCSKWDALVLLLLLLRNGKCLCAHEDLSADLSTSNNALILTNCTACCSIIYSIFLDYPIGIAYLDRINIDSSLISCVYGIFNRP